MRQLFWSRLDVWARSLFPFLITLFLAIVVALPIGFPSFSSILPAMTVISVYYWVVHRPELLPVWSIGLLGLLQDLLIGGPPGVMILALLFVYAVVTWQRKIFASASFGLIWIVFMAIALGALALVWALTSLSSMTYFDPRPVFFQYLLTIATYPCFAWIMIRGQRFFDA